MSLWCRLVWGLVKVGVSKIYAIVMSYARVVLYQLTFVEPLADLYSSLN